MDMRLDQSSAAQAAFGVMRRCLADDVALERRDAASLEADVGGVVATEQAGVADHEVEHSGSLFQQGADRCGRKRNTHPGVSTARIDLRDLHA